MPSGITVSAAVPVVFPAAAFSCRRASSSLSSATSVLIWLCSSTASGSFCSIRLLMACLAVSPRDSPVLSCRINANAITQSRTKTPAAAIFIRRSPVVGMGIILSGSLRLFSTALRYSTDVFSVCPAAREAYPLSCLCLRSSCRFFTTSYFS